MFLAHLALDLTVALPLSPLIPNLNPTPEQTGLLLLPPVAVALRWMHRNPLSWGPRGSGGASTAVGLAMGYAMTPSVRCLLIGDPACITVVTFADPHVASHRIASPSAILREYASSKSPGRDRIYMTRPHRAPPIRR